jgi:hypothetical protein
MSTAKARQWLARRLILVMPVVGVHIKPVIPAKVGICMRHKKARHVCEQGELRSKRGQPGLGRYLWLG